MEFEVPNEHKDLDPTVLEQMYKYATLTDASYRNHQGETPDDLEKSLKEQGLDFDIDPQYTDSYSTTLVGDAEVVMSVRGSDFAEAEDVLADLAILSGRSVLAAPERFTREEQKFLSLRDKYPDKKLVLAGHSLAGTIIDVIGDKHDVERHMFNPGTSYPQFAKATKDTAECLLYGECEPKRNLYTTGWSAGKVPADILSGLQFSPIQKKVGMQVIDVKAKQGDSSKHRLSNFLPKSGRKKAELKITSALGPDDICKIRPFLPRCKALR